MGSKAIAITNLSKHFLVPEREAGADFCGASGLRGHHTHPGADRPAGPAHPDSNPGVNYLFPDRLAPFLESRCQALFGRVSMRCRAGWQVSIRIAF